MLFISANHVFVLLNSRPPAPFQASAVTRMAVGFPAWCATKVDDNGMYISGQLWRTWKWCDLDDPCEQ